MKLEDGLKQATEGGSSTLVGYFGGFPRKYGNCFSVLADEKYYRILNFNQENLKHLIKTGVVSYPIQISVLRDKFAVIIDPRIPDEYYSREFCSSCTPEDLLPAPQRIHQILEVQRGNRTETLMEMDGVPFKMIGVNVKAQPGIVYAPYTIEQADTIEIQCGEDFNPKEITSKYYSCI